MAITAQMVKDLRERTGAGMMECKKALVASEGDMEAAIEHLRKSGLAKADKKMQRVAAEGEIALARSEDGTSAVLVEVNCETDFVGKDDNFRGFARQIAERALGQGVADVDSLLEQSYSADDGRDIHEVRKELVAKLGENIQVRRMARIDSSDGLVGAYTHGQRIGVLVEVVGGDEALAKDLAMHIAAVNPEHISADDVPADVLERERSYLRSQAEESGKPADIVEKMVDGRLNKRLSEITLLGQPFVKDQDMTVDKLLAERGAKVRQFHRLEVGEGVEKSEDNFAEEVMAQVRG